MKEIDIKKLSKRYTVRKLNLDDVQMIYAFCKRNTQYYEYCGKEPSIELIEKDIEITPPGIPIEQKYYIGFFDNDKLVAVMDLVDGYPTCDYVYIGFFMMVVFEQGKPKKNAYRKFRLRTVTGPDDYASMKEVLSRRFTDEKMDVLPDVIMMDGGKGQVNVALMVLDSLGLDIPVCGMVKDDNHRTRGLYYNNVEVKFPKGSEAMLMVTALQDEAHRFAIEYHRQLRSKNQVHSVLDEIPGVGENRRKQLLKYFGEIRKIREATISELAEVPGIPESVAKNVYEFFHAE